ncbi:hypothetical protein SBOR_7363 [Sclerotinia borealis F-4128]|uniref:Uncharacterized protein n=1 Tax=Sclerotinia borealis (strain F-4128) TaxID=1432307 RepID=W9C644_SCLBF|nr:hypothetical protein SBOR_7363 [Sclerotinia borealis F-4128]
MDLTSRITKTISWSTHQAIANPSPPFRRQAPPTDCSQAEQSASRVSQQASQSIQQAKQSASQAVQQASQSASNSIQQANNSASQLIAAASRSSSSVVSSASSAMQSIQASASSAVARANGAMQSAQFTASLLQQEVSKAETTAAAANRHTEESQNAAITATQAALAIIGSIIASTLLTMLVFWCIIRYRKKKLEERRTDRNERHDEYNVDEKPPVPRIHEGEREDSRRDMLGPQRMKSTATVSSLSSSDSYAKVMHDGQDGYEKEPTMKETYLEWNPKDPPKAPTLSSWLQVGVKDGVSPFASGPINLPISGDNDGKGPLDGQLRSPLSTNRMRSPRIPINISSPAVISTIPDNKQSIYIQYDQDISKKSRNETQPTADTEKESIWTNDTRSSTLRSESALEHQGFKMVFPQPTQPIRQTAEWFMEQQQEQQQNEIPKTPTQNQHYIRESLLTDTDSPSTTKMSRINMNAQPKTPKLGVGVSIKSMKGEVHYVNSVRSAKSLKGLKSAVSGAGTQSEGKTGKTGGSADEGRRGEEVERSSISFRFVSSRETTLGIQQDSTCDQAGIEMRFEVQKPSSNRSSANCLPTMGNCLVRLQAEMLSPPPNSGNWENLGPRKVLLVNSQHAHMRSKSGNGMGGSAECEKGMGVPLGRRETPSGIEGLTFDYAGRPVWRDPKSKTIDSDDSDVTNGKHTEEKRGNFGT